VGVAQLSSDFFDLLIFYFILCRIRIQIQIGSTFHRFHSSACKAGILGGEELVGEAQLSSDFFALVNFVNSFYVGSGSKSGSGVHSTGSTTLLVRLVPILGGEELVGEAQLSSDFSDLLTFVNSLYVGSGSKSGSGVHSVYLLVYL
jgi:hypothetical protein